MTQRKPAPAGHQAGKAGPGSRHAVLAFDKPTFAQESGTVSGEHRVYDEPLQDRLDAPHLDRLLAGADERLACVFGSLLTDDVGQGAQPLSLLPRLVEPPLQESQYQMEHGVPLVDGFVGLHPEVPQAQRLPYQISTVCAVRVRSVHVGTEGAVCSGNPYTGVPLVPQSLIPLVNSDTVQRPVALEGANASLWVVRD